MLGLRMLHDLVLFRFMYLFLVALHALHLCNVLLRTEPFDGCATALDDTLSVLFIANVVDD